MVNLSHLGGHVPKNWKTVMINLPPNKANVELVYKNFRSLSNLPFISKVLEKAALKQLLFLLDHGEKKYSAPLENIRKLGSWVAVRMRMNVNIGKIHSEVFRGVLSITQRRKFPSMQSTKTLVHALVSSRLDYCNSLLFRFT